MQKVIYKDKGGCGLILENGEEEKDFIEEKSVILHGEELVPGSFTNLDNLFNKPIRYAGILKNEKDSIVMCFHTGNEENLFSEVKYYYCFFWISQFRIANKYSENTARDFNWINNNWK